MIFSCKENLEVQVYKHPHYQSLNEKLMEDLNKLSFVAYKDQANFTNVRGKKLSFAHNYHDIKPKGVVLIENWVKQLINVSNVDINFKTWATLLDKGEETLEHDHYPLCTMVYVYFVNTPKGSSPLVFPRSGRKVKAEAGTLVIHPSTLRHKVPVNKSDGRVTIASNIDIIETVH